MCAKNHVDSFFRYSQKCRVTPFLDPPCILRLITKLALGVQNGRVIFGFHLNASWKRLHVCIVCCLLTEWPLFAAAVAISYTARPTVLLHRDPQKQNTKPLNISSPNIHRFSYSFTLHSAGNLQ